MFGSKRSGGCDNNKMQEVSEESVKSASSDSGDNGHCSSGVTFPAFLQRWLLIPTFYSSASHWRQHAPPSSQPVVTS